jgi:hypothetical protein
MTTSSNIVLICCVNPNPSHYEHSLPAIKFCARIRDCIVKKLSKGPVPNLKLYGNNTMNQNQSLSIEEIEYNQESERRQSPHLDTVKEMVDHIKDELATRQLNKDIYNSLDQDKWAQEKIEAIERLQ